MVWGFFFKSYVFNDCMTSWSNMLLFANSSLKWTSVSSIVYCIFPIRLHYYPEIFLKCVNSACIELNVWFVSVPLNEDGFEFKFLKLFVSRFCFYSTMRLLSSAMHWSTPLLASYHKPKESFLNVDGILFLDARTNISFCFWLSTCNDWTWVLSIRSKIS